MAKLALYRENGIIILHNMFQQQQPSKKDIIQCKQAFKSMLTKKAINFILPIILYHEKRDLHWDGSYKSIENKKRTTCKVLKGLCWVKSL